MAANTANPGGVNPLLYIVLGLLAIVLAGVVLEAVIYTEHALTSHPGDLADIDNCYDNDGNIISGTLSSDYGRWAEFCDDNKGHVFWRIFVCSGKDKIIMAQFKQIIGRTANYIANKEMVAGTSAC